ncbi:MAG: B12-binding domain-containing radical SAM protein [Spirochaetes bacterium]|nr:B12-binding domain-containing radical SAM protein [Spirochaetota bacterium]
MRRLRIFLVHVGRRQPLLNVTPPLGIMYLAAYIRSKFDVDIRLFNQKLDNTPNDECVRMIRDFNPDVVGLSVMTPNAHALPYLTGQIRRALPGALIVLGGPHISACGASSLDGNEADAAVVGEGELVFEQLLRARYDGGSLADVPGLIHRSAAGEIVENPGSIPPLDDLDALPFPAYDLINLPAYWKRQPFSLIPRLNYAAVFSSRGCPFHCIYCHRIFGERFRAHSAGRILDEIAHYRKTYGVKNIEVYDDIFNLDRKRVVDFSDGMKRRGISCGLVFPNGLRTDTLDEATIDALVEAGMYYSSFPLESGSPRIQKVMGKNLNIPRFMKNLEYAVSRRVFSYGFVMFGFPTETEEDITMTIDAACSSKLHVASFFTLTPFPNTRVHGIAMEKFPERMSRINYDDVYYADAKINLTEVSDDLLYYYQRMVYRKFFLDPTRIARIMKDYPNPLLLLKFLPAMILRASKGLFS